MSSDALPPRRAEVARLLADGLSRAEVARRLGVSRPTVTYHARLLGLPPGKGAERYDWAEIQAYYDAGHSVRECCAAFGCSSWSWHQAVKREVICAREQEMALEDLLVVGRRTNRRHLCRRLFRAGLKENRCEVCGLSEWLGKPLSIQLHHRNGDGLDNRLENLALLCPNCHSQTNTWGGRNRGGPERRRARMANHPGSSTIAEGGSGDRGPNRPSAYSMPTHPFDG